MEQAITDEKPKKFITVKSVTWFILASAVCICYYIFIDWALMQAQGLDFLYLWHSGSDK